MIDLESIRINIEKEIASKLECSGIKFRIFSRVKSPKSLERKLDEKKEKYKQEGRKMQDIIGVRITLYHVEDVSVVYQYYDKLCIEKEVDTVKNNEFNPVRLNLVMKLPLKYIDEFNFKICDARLQECIDKTYELQIRTVFSEGWHEVEHDLRYKCDKTYWKNMPEYDRRLNGIFASLENAEWAMQTLFDKIAYMDYLHKAWTPMIRNKMRLQFSDEGLSQDIINVLDQNNEIAKRIFKSSREEYLSRILENDFNIALKYDHIVHVLNRITVHSKDLLEVEKELLKSDLNKIFGVPNLKDYWSNKC